MRSGLFFQYSRHFRIIKSVKINSTGSVSLLHLLIITSFIEGIFL